MTGSGLAGQVCQSLEIIAWGTHRSVGQVIPQYCTNGQYGIEQSAKNATAHDHVGDPAEVVEREGRGLWCKKQRSLKRSECRALLVVARATKVRFWPSAKWRHLSLRSAWWGWSGLTLLTLSSSHFDPKPTSTHRPQHVKSASRSPSPPGPRP